MTVGQVVVSLRFWLFFFCVFAGCGAGLMTVNNLAQIVSAQGGSANLQVGHAAATPAPVTVIACVAHDPRPTAHDPRPTTQAVLVSLFSVLNAYGRIATGVSADLFRDWLPSTILLVIAVSQAGVDMAGGHTSPCWHSF